MRVIDYLKGKSKEEIIDSFLTKYNISKQEWTDFNKALKVSRNNLLNSIPFNIFLILLTASFIITLIAILVTDSINVKIPMLFNPEVKTLFSVFGNVIYSVTILFLDVYVLVKAGIRIDKIVNSSE